MKNVNRRPAEYSNWKSTEEMRQNAFFKIAWYKVSLHADPDKMIDLEMTFPFVRYSPRGQQRSVELNRRSEDWLLDAFENRMLLNPAYSNYDVAMLFDNRSTGRPQKILRYYEKFLSGTPRRFNADQWPMVTKTIYENLIQSLQ